MESQTAPAGASIPLSLLVSATYDSKGGSAVLKFYEPKSQKIILWADATGHKPYCYSRLTPGELDFLREREDVIDIQSVRRRDLLNDGEVDISKIIVKDPLAIGGTQTSKSIRNSVETWESDIKYYENYLYDESLTVGKYYEVVDGKVRPHDMEETEEVRQALGDLHSEKSSDDKMVNSAQFRQFTEQWIKLLGQPIPKIKRLSFDIEVESEIGRIPDPKIAEKPVTAVGFDGTDGFRQVFVLKKKDCKEGTNELDPGIKVVFYDADKEKEMIADAFRVIESFPFILTYNGDEFDMPYLYNRAQRLGIPYAKIPLYMMRDSATLKHGVHIDLYRTLSNRSFQIYAFSAKYSDYALNSVSKALLGEGKVDYGIELDDLDLYQTANYCYNDARLTHRLTTFNNNVLMDLLVVISRIAKMPIDDIARMGVSQWIRSLLYYEHRQQNALIPRRDELEKKSKGVSNDAVIKDKKFRGGLVVEPEEGIHFGVTVMDFACFDSQTEVLTRDGWKNHTELKIGDVGLSVNLASCTVEENAIEEVFRYEYDDYLYNIKTPEKLDFIFTPNHRMVYKGTKSGGQDVLMAEQLKDMAESSYHLPCFGVWHGRNSKTLTVCDHTFDTNLWLEYLGRFLGDGAVSGGAVSVYADAKDSDAASLCGIIKGLGFAPILEEQKGRTAVTIQDSRLAKHLELMCGNNRSVPQEYVDYSADHLKYLLKGLVDSGGSVFSTLSKKLADGFQLLALKCGQNCTIEKTQDAESGEVYSCALSGPGDKCQYAVSEQSGHISQKHYTGMVWCARTKNTTLIIRRRGRVVVTGNSLYPSIIKVKNLSYETVRCPHEECKSNAIPGTNHWACTKRNGMTSLLIGSLRDLRVNYYKSLSKDPSLTEDQRQQYTVVSQALKVILNASYGVMGAEIFPLYFLPAAEATTAIGRHIIMQTIDGCRKDGVQVLYGDTDSLFVKNPTAQQIRDVVERAKSDHGVELEIDKEYRYVVLSNRKKNYFGVTKAGKVDVKGLTGKKRHTPPFIKSLFYVLLDVLSEVQDKEGFESAKRQISEKIAECGRRLEAKEIPLKDLAFNVMTSKAPAEYIKTVPQHIRAAKLLESKREIKKGDIISYVKTLGKPGVKPVEMANQDEIDTKKYTEALESTLDQITSSMDLDFDQILGKPKQTGLDEFFDYV